MLMEKIMKFLIAAIMAVAGAALMQLAAPYLAKFISTEILKIDLGFLTMSKLICIVVGGAIGGTIGSLLAPYCIKRLRTFTFWVEQQLNKMPIHDVIAGVFGLAFGLIIANLLGAAFSKVPLVGDYVPILLSIVLGYLGVHIMIKKRSDIVGMFDFIPRFIREYGKQREAVEAAALEKKLEQQERARAAEEPVTRLTPEETAAIVSALSATMAQQNASLPMYKLLDTSVIIDGRIADILKTGFLEGTLLIPVFVLEELQHIADSADVLKRTRGRRGLDILQRIQTDSQIKVEIDKRDFEDIAEVDSKLIRLAQLVEGKIITNDFNLNKVAALQGVSVLNINDLANAVKPVVIPGETMQVTVVKQGKEQGQGLAYLDDGTMIVIENGNRHLNSKINVEVTTALQTSAGRMIFAKPVR